MKKRILSILLSVCMLLSVVPMMGITASAAEIDRSGWTIITGTMTITADGNYYLNGDVVGNITVNSGVTATIDLNGYVLKGNVPTPAQGTPGSVILNHGTLTILDNSPDAVHYFTYNAEGAWVLDTEAPVASDTVKIIDLAAFSLNAVSDTSKTYHIKVCGGCITGSVGGLAFSYTEDISETEHLLGSGVYNDGTLNVNGGNICGNEGAEGAGIGCYNGTLNLNGGNICGNYVTEKKPSFSGKISNIKPKGAGVCCIKSTGSFNGCNVIGNSGDVANLCMGGGVYACSDSNLTISAGNISNNTARDGGGLYILKSVLTMNGGTVGYNNASAGGGVFLDINAVFTLKNGCIEGNTAESGGGLYLATKTYCYMYGGYIKDNEATEQAGGFFSNGYFYMYGGSIADNTANIGGGVFVALNASFCSLGGSITGNTANIGGGVYSYNSIGVASTGVISENTADIGGGIYANSNIDISSGCYVKGNTKTGDSSASNIYLKNGKTICYVDDPEHPGVEENVGVTLESGTGKATVSAQEDYSKFFFSDNPDYDTYNSGKNNDQFVYIGAPVARDMRKEYLHETITDAIDVFSEGYYDDEKGKTVVDKTGTVKLINNSKEDVTIDSDTTITLDMCGYTLTGTGGGSVITNNGTLTLNNGTVTGGAAENGGAVNNTGKLTAKAVTFTGNSASGNGGAIYCSNDAQILLNGCTLKNNTASNNGGAIFTEGGEAETKITSDKCILIDTVIEQNSATLGGGVYYKKTTPGTSITVTFETGEFAERFGNVSSITKLYHTGDTYGELPDFDNSYYYSFDGWYTESSGGTKVSATDVIDATEDFTLYARKNACFAAGTLITMANGTTKKIEDISEGDVVKTFDHESGTVSSAEVYLAYKGETTAIPFTLTFDNNATLSIVGCHDLFEQSSLKYITLSYENVNDYIGKCFYGEDGAWHKLVSVICETNPCEYYSLYTAVHQNCYANGFLSVPDDADYILKIYELDENLKANEEQLSADIKEYGLTSYEYAYDLTGLSREWYDACNVKYMFIACGKGLYTEEEIVALYDSENDNEKQPQPMFTASPMFASAGLSATADPVLDDFTVGVLTIGDGTKISNNTGGNLYLADDDSLITLYGTRSDMCVGITTATAPTTEEPVKFTTNGTKDDKKFFFSDSDAYGVKYNTDGYLELVVIDYSTMPKMNFSANLTLAQNIDIGITVAKNNSSAVNIDADKLKIYADGEVVTLNDELEGTLAKVEPKDIGTLTGVTVEYDGIIVKGFGYSVAKYCAAAFKAYANDSDTYASLNTLCEAILNYGKYAEDYANNNTASTVNAGHEIDFSKVNLPTSQKVFASNTTYGATGSGAYLTLESTVKLNYYVKSSFAYNNSDTKTQNFFILNSENKQIDPKKVSISEAEGGYIISIDLYAYQLCNEYTLKVKDVDLKDFCITFGVYDYCTEVQDMSGSAFTDTLKTLCKAIYSYSEAVRSYSAE